jgi:hypothetical protein
VRVGLSTWIGGTGPRDPWRPSVADTLDDWACIDLRGYGRDRCLVVAPALTGTIAGIDVDLGDNALATFGPAVRAALANRLGVTVDADDTIGDILFAILAADLLPDHGRWKVTCAGVDLFDRPVVAGGATDDFNRSNGGLGASWETGGSGITIASNQVRCDANANDMALWVTTIGADIYSQHVHQFSNASSEAFAVVRGDWNGSNAYCYEAGRKWNESYVEIREINGNLYSPTQLAQSAHTWSTSTNYTTKITVSGSLISVYVDSSFKTSVTDTTLGASYTQAGFAMDAATADTVTLDNWEAGLLTSPPLFISPGITTYR